jgi:hypothetical protein
MMNDVSMNEDGPKRGVVNAEMSVQARMDINGKDTTELLTFRLFPAAVSVNYPGLTTAP